MTNKNVKFINSAINGIAIERLPLSEISGIHNEIENIWSESGASDLTNCSVPIISRSDVERYTAYNPITLHLFRKKLYVISNIQIYRAACLFEDSSVCVYARIITQHMSRDIREIIRNELLIYPSMHKGSFDPNYMYRIHQGMNESKKYNGLDDVSSSKYGFSRWMSVNVRKIK